MKGEDGCDVKRPGRISRRTFLKVVGTVTAVGSAAIGLAKLADLAYPAGENLLVESPSTSASLEERWVPTTCWIGKQDCGVLARVVDGRVVKLEGHPAHPRNRGTLCPKGQAQIMAFYDPYRVKAPLKRVNEKGVSGEWVEVSWDEALSLVAAKVKDVRARDPRLLVWQKGRSKAKAFYDGAFVKASGATKLHHGAYCSDAGYRAVEYTIGFHGVLHPDFRYCRYLLSWGWNMVNAGGDALCWITWPQQFLDARERGMKVVTIDPTREGMGPHTDEWLPIRPGTDLAFFLAVARILVAKGYVDKEYLLHYTNSPFLVNPDGYFIKKDEKPLVWDLDTESAQPYGAPGVQPALEGEYGVEDLKVKTAFQLFKEHVAKYTPEWAADVCGLSAAEIEQVAIELGENALIGSKIVLEGIELPYRPVGIMAYHVAQQELGFQATRAAVLVFMLLGAIEAVGGVRSGLGRSVHANFESLDKIKIKDPPYNIYLKDSKYYPINSNNSSIVAQVMLDPTKYGVDYVPEVLIIHMANPAISFTAQDMIWKSYMKYKFIAAIDPWMSETADYFADVVLPAATIEKYEGPLGVGDQYSDATALRLPPMEPLFQTKGDIEIYIELCEKAGILYGEGGYIDQINKALKLKDPYKLDLYAKPDARDIYDRWAKSSGIEEGIGYFERHGVKVSPLPVKKLYASAWDRPYGGIRHRLYGESLLKYRETMIGKGVHENYWRDYTPLPMWRTPTMDHSPPDHDLYLISRKKVEFKQARSTFIPLLHELEPMQLVEINPRTAAAKGISEGDEVWVESHNAITGEIRRISAKVRFVNGIKPDTICMPHHYGFWVHPVARGSGPTPNSLFFTGEGYTANTADATFHVKVRVYKR